MKDTTRQVVALALISLSLTAHLGAQEPAKKKAKSSRREVSWVNPKLPEMPGLTHKVLKSTALECDVGYVVWTPPEYAASADKRYPVIYFLHGLGGHESADAAGFSGRVTQAIAGGAMPPVVCVFPNGGTSFYQGAVESMIVDELIPQIDKDYRTLAQPQSRAVAGFSMGGSGSVHLAMMHPDLFCAAGSLGGFIRGGSDQVQAAIEKALPVWKQNRIGFYLVNGDQDRPDAFKAFAERLQKSEIAHEVVVLPETPHNLGLYYERSGEKLLAFISKQLRGASSQ